MRKVLMIDDSKTVVTGVSAALKKEGFEVMAPERFVDIHTMIRAHRPEIIILDLNMPTLSGEQIGRFLRKHEFTGRIIIYSGEPADKLAAAAQNIGAAGWVSKDQPLGDLLGVVRGQPLAV